MKPEKLLDHISALFRAKSEAEALQVLRDHPEILDEEAAIMMQQLITSAKRHGDAQAQEILVQMKEFLKSLRSSDSREATENGSELSQILQELSRPAQLADIPRRIEICRRALKLISPENASLWAALQVDLGNSLAQSTFGKPAENIELAIQHYLQALKVRTQKDFPVDWATIQYNLAAAYYNRILGDRAENIELAIEHYLQALKIRTQKDFPTNWAATQNNLANAYNDRIRGDRAENIELAIEHCQQALKVRTQKNFPLDWAMTQNNLANAYSTRIRGDRAENIELAIEHYQQALKIRTQKDFMADWAMTQNNLAAAYCDRIRGDRAENIELAIEHCQQALKIYIQIEFPARWAATQNILANAYNDRIRGDRAENIELAIEHYQRALKIRTQKDFPPDWAMTQNNLANAYNDRIRGDRAENIELAIEHYQQALKVRTQKDFPADWAMTQNNLANAYRGRIRGDRAENIELAIEHCQQVLKIYIQIDFPADWAATQNNLANAYNDRIWGDRAENIELAIEHYQQALKVRTEKDFPADWAATQNNLANAYRGRIRGERAENIELAIEHGQKALKIRTQKDFPADWAMTQNNLANAYNDRIRGERAENIELAIEHYQQALKIRTQKDFPANWALTQNNLANAYRGRIRGDRAENIKMAIEHYEQALKIYGPNEFPNNCRGTARNLGNLCLEASSLGMLEDKRLSIARKAYSLGIDADMELYNAAIFLRSREAEMAETQDLYRRAGYALARSGDVVMAAQALERGRARGLGLSLARDRSDMERVREKDPQVYKDYWQTVAELQNLESLERAGASAKGKALPTLRDLMMQARTRLGEVLDRIRRIQGYENFLKEPSWQEIADATIVGQPLVYLAAAPAGGVALIVHRPSESEKTIVDSVNLDGFSEQRLQDLLKIWFDAYSGWQEAQDNLSQNKINPDDYLQKKKRWFDAIEKVTGQLWQKVMGPVFGRLHSLDAQQSFLIPTGLLSLLPLHAAWQEEQGRRTYLQEMMPVSYIPSARSLAHVRRIACAAGSEKLLAVDEPRTIKPAPLLNSHAEVTAIISHFPSPQMLEHEKATRSAALQALPGAQVVHFSCHGGANWSDPEKSGILMANSEMLTVKDLFELHLDGARLATLSACETGVPGTKLPDEVVSLPSAFIRAGFAGVIGSLWTVPDQSTAKLMTCFYQLWREKGKSPAQALAEAQKRLRESEEFQHPFYWAAFYLTGV